jgi:hypothetical protein
LAANVDGAAVVPLLSNQATVPVNCVSSTAVVDGVAALTGAVTLEVRALAVIAVSETANELDVAAASDVGVKVSV